jgi:hypothetical protein
MYMKPTIRTLAGVATLVLATACAPTAKVQVPPRVLEADPAVADHDVHRDSDSDPGEVVSGPPWSRLPDSDRPGRGQSLQYRGCVMADGMGPC